MKLLVFLLVSVLLIVGLAVTFYGLYTIIGCGDMEGTVLLLLGLVCLGFTCMMLQNIFNGPVY